MLWKVSRNPNLLHYVHLQRWVYVVCAQWQPEMHVPLDVIESEIVCD